MKKKFLAGLVVFSSFLCQGVNAEEGVILKEEVKPFIDRAREIFNYSISDIELTTERVFYIYTSPNFSTIMVLPFDDFTYDVGNGDVYFVKKDANMLIIKQKKAYTPSDLTIMKDGKAYKFVLIHSDSYLDSIVRVKMPEQIDYQKELNKVIMGQDSKVIKIKPVVREAGEESKAVIYKDYVK